MAGPEKEEAAQLSHRESHCAHLHLSVTYNGTALQVQFGPLLLG